MPQPMLRPAPRFLILCSLLLLAGCGRQASTSRTETSGNPANPPAPKSPAGKEWAKLVVGSWVSKPSPPEGGPREICATDTNFDFDADGSFATSSDGGRWSVNGNRLVTTITASNPDGDIGPPMKKLTKPIVIRSQLVGYKAPVLTAITDGVKEYWYRCPNETDANP